MKRKLKRNTVYNMDGVKFLKRLSSKSVDLIVTDPPYKVISGGRNSQGTGEPSGVLLANDGKIFEYNDIKIQDWLPECYRVLKDESHIYIMTNMLNLLEYMNEIEKQGFKIHNLLVWVKNTATPNKWYMKNVEYCIFARKGKAKFINNPSSKTAQLHKNKCKHRVNQSYHPTEKPLDLIRNYISNSAKVGDLVIDPFVGGGSTSVVCQELGIDYIVNDIDIKFVKVTKNRLELERTDNWFQD